jgi:ribonuclease D
VFSVPHAPQFIDRPDTAPRQLGVLAGATDIALDTEGASFHRFVDRVYLLQLSTRAHTMIVDPLAIDAATLAPVRALVDGRHADSSIRVSRRSCSASSPSASRRCSRSISV